MKEMKYDSNIKIDLLDEGYINEGNYTFEYVILNLGTHPTAYILIPPHHKYYKKDYMEIPLDVYGGLTYSRDYLFWNENDKMSGWYIGWDYCHYGDYFFLSEGIAMCNFWKKWTTEEILEDVKNAVKQLSEV